MGHSSANCHLGYRCVKCAETHTPGQCKRTKSDESVPYCVKCKSNGHVASYRGCPYLIVAQNTLKVRRNTIKMIFINKKYNVPTQQNNRPRYVQALKNNLTTHTSTNRTTLTQNQFPQPQPQLTTNEPPISLNQLKDLLSSVKTIINTITEKTDTLKTK